MTPDQGPLGVVDAWIGTREFKNADGNRPGILERTRWTEVYERGGKTAATLSDARFAHVATNREADILDV